MSEVSGRWVNDEEDHLHGDLVDTLDETEAHQRDPVAGPDGCTVAVRAAGLRPWQPLSIVVTAGQRSDSPQFQAVLEAIAVPRTSPGRALKTASYKIATGR
jgi:hypothetical protein